MCPRRFVWVLAVLVLLEPGNGVATLRGGRRHISADIPSRSTALIVHLETIDELADARFLVMSLQAWANHPRCPVALVLVHDTDMVS